MLEKHADFAKPGALAACSYDWRQDWNAILSAFRRTLIARFKVHYDSRGRALRSGRSFYLIGHSMGALLTFLAVARGLIHQDDIAQVILLAPPFRGSPFAYYRICEGDTPCPFRPGKPGSASTTKHLK